MKYVITAAVAALALFVTAGTASAQHPGSYSGHYVAPSHHHVAPSHHGHQSGATYVYPPSGFGPGLYSGPTFGGPVYGGGVVASPAPVYGPTYSPSYGRSHVPHHRSHR